MAQEDQPQRCGNGAGSCGGVGNAARSSRKQKPKKVPQRGLGVAQLERIRLEEQQKKDAAVLSAATNLPSPMNTVTQTQKPSYLSSPIPSFHHSNLSSLSSVPFPRNFPPSNSLLRTNPSIQNLDFIGANTVPLSQPPAWPPGEVPGHGNASVHKMWDSPEYTFRKENGGGMDSGLAFRQNLGIPCEADTMWSLPNLTQRAQHFQQSSSPMVNIPSPLQSSALNYQMEPPSNQSYYGNNTHFWPEEDRIVGTKRPYPFSPDFPAVPPFLYRGPSAFQSNNRSDEAAASGSGSGSNNVVFNPSNQFFREPTSSSSSALHLNPKKNTKETEAFNGDFLTLGLPTMTSMCPSSTFRLPTPYSESFPSRGGLEGSTLRQGPRGFHHQQLPYYSFIPPASAQGDQATDTDSPAEEAKESVDLNLKL